MTTSTLTSLAILKVNVDHGDDYLDYLRPFVLHAAEARTGQPITEEIVHDHIKSHFGLIVPAPTVAIVMRRLARAKSITRRDRVYFADGALPISSLDARRTQADRHISSVIADFRQYSLTSRHTIETDERAVVAICAFLSQFDVSCLRAYLRGTALPALSCENARDVVLVSSYVRHIMKAEPKRFDSFVVLVRGHMLANALLCPDLEDMSPTYDRVTFLFDTPLLVRCLGLDGEEMRHAAVDLLSLLKNLGGKLSTLSHLREELEGVVRGAADRLATGHYVGQIVLEARKRGTTRSDLLWQAERLDDDLEELGVAETRTPQYVRQYQINEERFESMLTREVSYARSKSRVRDINSVRSIYVLRRGRTVRSIEKARAVLVTSNTGLASAAARYDRELTKSRSVSSVITDVSLANVAWLKRPMGAREIPRTQLMAMAYGALTPSEALWDRYMREIDRLESDGRITPKGHQILRSAPGVQEEVMQLTGGDEGAISGEVVMDVYNRVKGGIDRDWKGKVEDAKRAQAEAERKREEEMQRTRAIGQTMYWRKERQVRSVARVVECALAVVVTAAGVAKWAGGADDLWAWLAAVVSGVWTFGSQKCDWTGRLREPIRRAYLGRWVRREAQVLGLPLEDIHKSDSARSENDGNS